ncbi:MAG: hypothetical protein DHS20C01_11360 [marine bacterium B5-7]|nr:MAG: hypothetical protein DHS20C01_11360 [marine bacterium B5-7]
MANVGYPVIRQAMIARLNRNQNQRVSAVVTGKAKPIASKSMLVVCKTAPLAALFFKYTIDLGYEEAGKQWPIQ